MTLPDHKTYYSRFLKGHEGKLHFAAHSHHFWPDVTREAQLAYWDDCAELSDGKWEKIFSEVIPKAQEHIAQILNLKDKEQIVFAPNTHELAARLLSEFLGKKELRILTSANEFHSWRRQVLRLKEIDGVQIEFFELKNLQENRPALLAELREKLQSKPDVFYISQVFFDSGIALTVEELYALRNSCSQETLMVVDGYHGFAAVPTDLSKLEGKIFYLGGGYKYAQAGEGAGFMVVPRGDWRPAYTGWFAEFGELQKPSGAEVGYRKDGMAFFGSTQDPSGLYRFNATWDLFKKRGLTVEKIHHHVRGLQERFSKQLPPALLTNYSLTPLFQLPLTTQGHFLTFEAQSDHAAQRFIEDLGKQQVIIDRRGKKLRFGFGLYQTPEDVDLLINRLENLAINS